MGHMAAGAAGNGGNADHHHPEDPNNLAEEAAAAENNRWLNDMRGWLLAVAALFVTLAFEAVLHRPDWLKLKWFSAKGLAKNGTRESTRAYFYLVVNICTFANALTAVVFLLWDSNNRTLLVAVKRLMRILSLSLACAFAACTSADWWMTVVVLLGIGLYAAGAVALVLGMHEPLLQWFRKMLFGPEPGPPAALPLAPNLVQLADQP